MILQTQLTAQPITQFRMCAAKKLDPNYREIIQRWRDSFDCLYKDWAVLTEIPKVFSWKLMFLLGLGVTIPYFGLAEL